MSRLTTLTWHFSDWKEKPLVTQDGLVMFVVRLDTFDISYDGYQPFTKNIISLNRAWHCAESRGHASWGQMCTQRPLMEAGDGRWLWPFSWWRFSPTAPSRASASSSRTWWRSTGRPTVGSPGSFPSACLSWPSMVSTTDEVELMTPDKTK